jgi:NAD(P)-dependent dehydrogenase (short-subunit alcohol dehydrogenase family)
MQKGKVAKLDIEATTHTKGVVEAWKVDLESYSSVKEFCQRAGKLERLDAVVENAGVAIPVWKEAEGMESTITVDVISTFLMALLLLPKLRESVVRFETLPHLTIVASDAHEQVCLHLFSDWRFQTSKCGQDVYNFHQPGSPIKDIFAFGV